MQDDAVAFRRGSLTRLLDVKSAFSIMLLEACLNGTGKRVQTDRSEILALSRCTEVVVLPERVQ